MSISFWLSLVVCVVAFLELWIDRRETIDNLNTANTSKDKRWHRFKLLVCWLVFLLALINVFVSGWESAKSNEEDRKQALAITNATNEIARLKMKVQTKPLAERLRICLNNIDPRILPALKAGTTRAGGDITITKLAELETLCNEPGSQKYISLKKLGGQKFMSDGTITTAIELSLTMDLNE